MRNPVFEAIVPNYRKRVLDITLREGRRLSTYHLPFAALKAPRLSSRNRVVSVEIDEALGGQGATIIGADGERGDLPSDFVLYYCDPSYDWSPLNQLKRALRERLYASKLSIRVLADALNTSPSQVVRLFDENRGSRQLLQLFKLAELAGYQVAFTLKKRKRAA